MPSLLQVTCALIPRGKAAKISAEESDRSMHQFSQSFPPTPPMQCPV